ncbi:MAG: Trk system potassium transporter TrkA [Candidatus Tectomicrobia bacterium]
MRLVIVGAGEVGYHIASRLSREKHDIVIVDQADELVERVKEELDVMAYQGHGATPAILERAGISQADMLIAVTSSDEVNLVACLLARQYGVPKRIARINAPDARDSPLAEAGKSIGIDLLINPSQAVAEEIWHLVKTPGAEEAADFLEGQVKLLSFRVQASAPIAHQRLRDFASHFARTLPFLIVAIQRERDTLIPTGNTVIEPDDHLLVIGKDELIRANLHWLGITLRPTKKVFIIGGGRVGLNVAQMLEHDATDYQVKILEKDAQHCQELASRLSHTLVLHGDATDVKVLEEEGIADMDMVIVVTDDEGTNLIAGLLAKTHGAHGIIILIKRPDLVPLVAALGIDAAISPRLITAGAILRYLRRGQVLSVFASMNAEAETLEMVAAPQAKIVGKPLRKMKMPAGVIIGAVAQGADILIPGGDTVIRAHDRVIVFALSAAVPQAEKLFVG